MGKSSSKVLQTGLSPDLGNINTGTVGANSRMNCLQIPQGLIGSSKSARIAIALNDEDPCIIQRVIAVLSAQIPAP